MLSSRLITKITEAERLIEREVCEGKIAALRDYQAQFSYFLDEAEEETIRIMSETIRQFFDQIRSKKESFFLDRIAYEEQFDALKNQEDLDDP